MRYFWAFLTGTILNAVIIGTLQWANATPYPATARGMLNYPTGSWATLLVLVWGVYFLALVAFAAKRKKEASRISPGQTILDGRSAATVPNPGIFPVDTRAQAGKSGGRYGHQLPQ